MSDFTFKVQNNPITIKQYLTDAEKFIEVHPLIYNMTDLGGNKYKIFEKIKIGPIPFRFTYKAHIFTENDCVKINATVVRLTTISMIFSFRMEGKITIVSENLTVNSPLPIRNYMNKLIKKQHQIMFNNIEQIKNED